MLIASWVIDSHPSIMRFPTRPLMIMHLSTFTDYSLRTLFLASANSGRLVTLAEISSYYRISIDHLRKVVHSLAKAGYLETHRGKYGGIRLAKKPADINLGELVRHTEGAGPLIDCHGTCTLPPLCRLKDVLDEALQGFYRVMDNYSLEALVKDPEFQQVLKLSS